MCVCVCSFNIYNRPNDVASIITHLLLMREVKQRIFFHIYPESYSLKL